MASLNFAGTTRLELATLGSTSQCSNQLSYVPMCRRRESNSQPLAYDAIALPLSYPGKPSIIPII